MKFFEILKGLMLQELYGIPYWAWFTMFLGAACLVIAAILIPCLIMKNKQQDEKSEDNTEEKAEANSEDTAEAKEENKKEEKVEKVEEKATVAPAEEKEEEKGKKTTAKKTTAKTATKTETKKEEAKETKSETKEESPASETKVYHISKRKEDKKWQVKAEGADKALRLFFTQSDAIEYAKKVAGNQEGRIVIHKEGGGFRKLNY